jgi:hypothetical protein
MTAWKGFSAACLPGTPPGLPSRKAGSTDLSPGAVPNHPGEPDGCSLPLLPRRWQASARMADWPLSLYITRPNRVHLCYGSRVRLARLRQTDCSVPRSLGYLLNGQLTGQAPFSLQDQPGLSWRSIHWFVCMRPTNAGNISVTASKPSPVLASFADIKCDVGATRVNLRVCGDSRRVAAVSKRSEGRCL